MNRNMIRKKISRMNDNKSFRKRIKTHTTFNNKKLVSKGLSKLKLTVSFHWITEETTHKQANEHTIESRSEARNSL